jgi:protein TonB
VEYPEEARKQGISGTVILSVLIGPEGHAKDVKILEPVHELLDTAAVAVARKVRYQPGKIRGVKVHAWLTIPVRFELD